jgi:hypothetical protein
MMARRERGTPSPRSARIAGVTRAIAASMSAEEASGFGMLVRRFRCVEQRVVSG